MSKLFWDNFLTIERKTISTQTEEHNTSVISITTSTNTAKDILEESDNYQKEKNDLISISSRLDELLDSITNLKNMLFNKKM